MRLRCHDSFQVITRLSPEEVRNTLAPFAMLLFGWGLTTFGYSLEADKAITRFCGLFPPI